MGTHAAALHMSKTAAHVQKYAAAIDAADNFQEWFNNAGSEAEAASNGHWDFAIHIASPEVRHLLGPTHDKTALEIGCGGGRLLAAASRYFGFVVGIDIHQRMSEVGSFLNSSGVRKALLFVGDGETIPVESESVDFVYSFIVMHHLQSLSAFESYIRESFRVLKRGGVAHLYYGESDRVVERDEYAANSISLAMPRSVAVEIAERAGFEVIKTGKSWRYSEAQLRHGYQGSLLLKR